MKIITRSQWGARPFRTPAPHVSLSSRTWLIVHYPGAGTPPRDVREYAKWIERIHMDQNGWRGSGYNYLIGANGEIAEGCGRDVVGAHSPPHNRDGIGVNVWTSNGKPTEAGKRACRELYDELCRQAGRKLRIGWHGMDYPTECPGPALRTWAQAGMPTTPTAPSAGSKPPPGDEIDMATLDELRKIVREEVRHGTPRADMKSHTSLDGGVVAESVAAAIRRAQTIGRQNRAKLNRIEKKLDTVVAALKKSPQAAAALGPAVFDIAAAVAEVDAADESQEQATVAEEV